MGDDAVQTNGLGDTVVVLPVGFGDDFGKAQLGGVQGDDEVVFIPVGESTKASQEERFSESRSS